MSTGLFSGGCPDSIVPRGVWYRVEGLTKLIVEKFGKMVGV